MIMDLYSALFPWQKNLIDKFKDRKSFGLFLDMGLGKTPISLAFAEANRCQKVIVITLNGKVNEPKTLVDSWYGWAARSNMDWTTFCKKEVVGQCSSDRNEVLVTNYESLFKRGSTEKTGLRLNDFLLEFISTCKGKNVAVILDESHKVKSQHSKQSKAVDLIKRALSKHSENVYMYLLSGTPFTTGYMDLYNQLKLLGCGWTKSMFKDQFCIMGHVYGLTEWQQPVVGYKNVDMLFALLHKYAITIDSKDVIDLPEQIFMKHVLKQTWQMKLFTWEKMIGNDINAELTTRHEPTIIDYETQKKCHNPFYRNIAYPDMNWFADTSGLFWLRARQLSIGFQGNATEAMWFDKSRLHALKKFLEENRDNYVLFYNFTPELIELYDICNELGYNIDIFCGEIKSLSNYERYAKDLSNGIVKESNNIILANFASGSTGMNWQAYSHCIIFSMPVYLHYAQAIKRLHRVGQKNTVIYHVFCQDNFLDNGMWQALTETKDYNDKMFTSDLNRIQELSDISRSSQS